MKPSPILSTSEEAGRAEEAAATGPRDCPWCGGADLSVEPVDKLRWAVFCCGCAAQGPAVLPGRGADHAEAAPLAFEAWNGRP